MSNLISIIRGSFDTAWNDHNVTRIMDHFADGAVVQAIPPLPGGPDAFRGKEQIRGFVNMLLPGFHVESSNFEEDGDHVSWYSTVSCDAFRQMGLDALEARSSAVIQEGKITSFQPTFTPASQARMQAGQHKAIAQRFYTEAINGRNLDLLDEILADDFVDHEVFPGLVQGREGAKQFFSLFFKAFPDVHWEVEDLLAEGDKVVCRVRMQGTHRGEFLSIPATERRIDVSTMDMVRFVDGKAVEHWGVTDSMAMMQQLGVLPEEQVA